MARTTDFSDLDVHSVLLIMKHLKSLEDQVNLARCSRKFSNAFVQLHHGHFKEIIDNEMKFKSLDEWRAFLWMCGANVKHMQLYNDDDHPLQLLPLASKFCTNLESITLHNVTVAKAQPFLLAIRTLKRVQIRNYKNTSKDLIKSMLRYLPYLNSLGLEYFDRKELQELRHFKNLRELQLYDEVTASDFVDIIKPMSDLRILQLRNAKKFLTTQTIKQLVAHCSQLEKLSFFDSDADLTNVAQFSNLKYLQVHCPEQYKTRLFKALAKKNASHLEYLVLHKKRWINEEQAQYIGTMQSLKILVCKPRDDRCMEHLANLTQLECLSMQSSRDVGEMALMAVLSANEKLRYLNICFCMSITDHFVMSALTYLAKRISHQPLELYAAATDIRRDIMDRLTADHRSKQLCLYFECSNGLYCDGHYYNDEAEFA